LKYYVKMAFFNDYLSIKWKNNMEDIYKAITEILQRGERASLATIVSKQGSTPAPIGSKMLVLLDGNIIGTVGGGGIEAEIYHIAKEVIKENSPRLVSFDLNENDSICGGKISVFIEPIVASEKVYIFGAGHIGFYLSKMAVMTDFKVIVIDDREEYANLERFPEAHKIIALNFKDAFEKMEIDDNSFIVIITRGHACDEQVLEWACGIKTRYIGMIGSKAKIQQLFSNLRQKGVDDQRLAEVHAPIGLDIGSETPAEIAVSILAEIIQVRRQ